MRLLGLGGATACRGKKGHLFKSRTGSGGGGGGGDVRGGLAWLSWPSPKPVTPRHLETITGNNEGSRGPGCSGSGLVCSGSLWASPAPTSTTFICLGTGHTAPGGHLSGKVSP